MPILLLLLSLVPFFINFCPNLVWSQPQIMPSIRILSLYSKCTFEFVRKKYSFVQLNTVYNQWLVSYCVQTSFILHFDLEYLTNKLVSTTCGALSNKFCMKLGLYLPISSESSETGSRCKAEKLIKDSSSDKLGPLEGALSDNYPSAGVREFS